MLIRKPSDIPSSEITPESVYLDRRRFLRLGAAGVVGAAVGPCSPEFGPDKDDPARNAPGRLKPSPWSVVVEGHCAKPGRYALEDFIKPSRLEDRTYRLRCVEAWSMVIPWRGFPLADVIKRAQPTSQAKYVELYTLLDPEQMPYQKTDLLDWPYVEGLRLDE